MLNHKKVLLLLTGFLCLTVVLFSQEIQSREMEISKMKQQNMTIVKMFVDEISQKLPQKIDAYTTLEKVEGKNTTIIYTFEINTGAKSDEAVKKEDKTRMKNAVTQGICQSSKRFLQADIDITYIYRSAASKAELFHFNVNKEICSL